VSIKAALGRLETRRRVSQAVQESGFSELPVTFEHAEAVGGLPPHHRDPFDRIIIASALVEGFTIVTSDRQFASYDVPTIDARR
jgi:PIN domain nuclease of toxin-antitoxin system